MENQTKIFVNEHFLSPEEVEYMLEAVNNLGWGDSGTKNLELPLGGFMEAARKDPIFERVEERIANQTGGRLRLSA